MARKHGNHEASMPKSSMGIQIAAVPHDVDLVDSCSETRTKIDARNACRTTKRCGVRKLPSPLEYFAVNKY
jgi:hypothetical protein